MSFRIIKKQHIKPIDVIDINNIVVDEKINLNIIDEKINSGTILSFGAKKLLQGNKIQYLSQNTFHDASHDKIISYIIPRKGMIKNIYVYQKFENWATNINNTSARYSLCLNDAKVVSFEVTTHKTEKDLVGPIRLCNQSNLIDAFPGDLVTFIIEPLDNDFKGGGELIIGMEFI